MVAFRIEQMGLVHYDGEFDSVADGACAMRIYTGDEASLACLQIKVCLRTHGLNDFDVRRDGLRVVLRFR